MSQLEYSTTSEGQNKITNMIWTVSDFMDLINNGTKKELRIESTDSTNEESDPRIQLKMQFKGMHNEIIEIYFLSPKPVLLEYKLNYYYCLHGTYRLEIGDTMKFKEYHIVPTQKWQYVHTILKSNVNDILAGNSLKLKFEFKQINNLKVDNNIPEVQLSNDFDYLLRSGIFSDVTMKSAEGMEFKVHKAILASRSTVLKALFEHNTTECLTNIVESPLESEVLQELLTFIYTDKSPRVDEILEKLLAAADYYQLNKLKSLCEEALHKKLTVENAIEFLQLADVYSASALKQWTLEYIKDGQAKLIMGTDGWAELDSGCDSGKLIKMIYKYIMDDVDENGLYSQKIYLIKDMNTETN